MCMCGPRAGEEAGKRVATVSTLQKAGPALKTSRKPSRRVERACNYFINPVEVNYPRHNTDRPIGIPASAREREGLWPMGGEYGIWKIYTDLSLVSTSIRVSVSLSSPLFEEGKFCEGL